MRLNWHAFDGIVIIRSLNSRSMKVYHLAKSIDQLFQPFSACSFAAVVLVQPREPRRGTVYVAQGLEPKDFTSRYMKSGLHKTNKHLVQTTNCQSCFSWEELTSARWTRIGMLPQALGNVQRLCFFDTFIRYIVLLESLGTQRCTKLRVQTICWKCRNILWCRN